MVSSLPFPASTSYASIRWEKISCRTYERKFWRTGKLRNIALHGSSEWMMTCTRYEEISLIFFWKISITDIFLKNFPFSCHLVCFPYVIALRRGAGTETYCLNPKCRSDVLKAFFLKKSKAHVQILEYFSFNSLTATLDWIKQASIYLSPPLVLSVALENSKGLLSLPQRNRSTNTVGIPISDIEGEG